MTSTPLDQNQNEPIQAPVYVAPENNQQIPVPQMQQIPQLATQIPSMQMNPTPIPGFSTQNMTAMPNIPNLQGMPSMAGMGGIVGNNVINSQEKRHRRSKHEQEGRTFQCQCGKSYLSQPALNNHKKTKHPELVQDNIKRGRGRPRKYPQTTQADFESTKYESFFAASDSRKPTGQEVNAAAVAEAVFHFLYEGEYKEKMFSRPNSIEDNFILKNLKEGAELPQKQKSSKCCDEVFYEYLKEFKGSTNEKFFTLLTKFVILFRECYDISRNKEKAEKKAVTNEITPEGLPDLCNEFYGEFMEPNEFFGIKDAEEKNEIIEIIQHFCIWLFKNEYTKSKLSLAS